MRAGDHRCNKKTLSADYQVFWIRQKFLQDLRSNHLLGLRMKLISESLLFASSKVIKRVGSNTALRAQNVVQFPTGTGVWPKKNPTQFVSIGVIMIGKQSEHSSFFLFHKTSNSYPES